MATDNHAGQVTYNQFRDAWLSEFEEANVSPLEKGRWFATKLVTEWLGVTTDDDDFIVCDGSGDGGIDIAYLKRADTDPSDRDDNSEEGDTWYLVQSKYGTAFAGIDTILKEGSKVIATLQGHTKNLSDNTKRLLQRLELFLEGSSSSDRIVLVFATTDPIATQNREALDNIKLIGRERVSPLFDVEELSLQTIWEGLDDVESPHLSISVDGQFVEQTPGLMVGTVPLLDLFEFMRAYRGLTGDLNQLYEKNVRQFLGGRRKINKGIARTLNENPEKFGLYNNGITIVVSDYSLTDGGDSVDVKDPYIVNGCQTTKTIWEVLEPRINPGGTGNDVDKDWKGRVSKGGVVTKIVRSDEAEITNITRFTNSQNSVREQDFIALNSGFQLWASSMAEDYNVYLEIQRGGITARKAWEKSHPGQSSYADYVNAFDLIKVYGAGWMSEPGSAFNKNAPFLPNGSVYDRILSRPDEEPPFGARDLYAGYKIKLLADSIGFGRNAAQPSRRQSRFLFYYVIMRMLGNVILLTPELQMPAVTASNLTEAVLRIADADDKEPLELLARGAVTLIDQYLTQGTSENSAFSEVSFIETHNGDLNGFLKAENLGKETHSPKLIQSLAVSNQAFDMSGGRDTVAQALISQGT